MSVKRIYVEKKPEFAVEAKQLLWEIRHILQIKSVKELRILSRYDVEGITDELYLKCRPVVFFEPQVDVSYDSLPAEAAPETGIFAVEYLPGQYDQRAASCEECIQIMGQCSRPAVRTAKVYILTGEVTDEEMARVKKHVINPVESREADMAEKDTLAVKYAVPDDVPQLAGFTSMTGEEVDAFVKKYGLAMDDDDLAFCRDYFAAEHRDPTLTEIRMIDTYWSDHCRHTTFLTTIDDVEILKPEVEKAFQRYLAARKTVYGDRIKPVNLMDMATMGGKYLKKTGKLTNLDESEEINACSIKINVDVNGSEEPWLLMFKNETHNHPTEIEPFGGAATCIGGAIRDPLSGRTYVYQAMRVTGASDPLLSVKDTLPGKLPQRKLVTTAAAGYSSYGNQIGLATGLVDEVYHPGYAAKRLEIGAVIGAAPEENVRREEPVPGDKVVLLGGRTGRDGIGGATGSSKSHNLDSIETCGAEVQKGNAPTERKLQRLFRKKEVTQLIKRCNDFGAGGVSVAIGELADGLRINLDMVPKKYEGLDGTELAISESQERMAVVLSPEDTEKFLEYAESENLEATVVAEVTEEPRLVMTWRGKTVVDVSREFLNSNGAEKHTKALVENACLKDVDIEGCTFSEKMMNMVSSLNFCSKQGLGERFDSTIGGATVLMPYGGRNQLTPIQTMAAKLPVMHGETTTVSGMAYGFHPELMEMSPYDGAYLAVVESVCKLAAAGFDTTKAYLTFQEYFQRMTDDPAVWGKPMAALLGALDAQLDLQLAAIGGKDSMSGTFEQLHVPPTLCSFAVAPGKLAEVISPEFKEAGHAVRLLMCDPRDTSQLRQNMADLHQAIVSGQVVSAWAMGIGGVAEAVFKMGLGNSIGVRIDDDFDGEMFGNAVGSFILEAANDCTIGEEIGSTIPEWIISYQGDKLDMKPLQEQYEGKLEKVFPYRNNPEGKPMVTEKVAYEDCRKTAAAVSPEKFAKPRVFIPVFPGTNCEYDTARAVERAGGVPEILVLNNLTPKAITESIRKAADMINNSQMIVLPGGFSAGDEPDGSAKFITAFFRSPEMLATVSDLLDCRKGLMLGICNGFQALIKLGLVPFGRIVDTDSSCPTLTYNEIGRHQSMLVRTRVSSVKSPWLSRTNVGDIHTVAISHGEGRFVCSPEMLRELEKNGQIATQYVDLDGNPTMDMRMNPNGSVWAVEGITSPDGRVLGKMGHSERAGNGLYKNVPGDKFQPIFEGGMDYFK